LFNRWKDNRYCASQFSSEHSKILDAIRDFIEAYSDGRFSDLHWVSITNQYGGIVNAEPAIRQRAGYWDDSSGSRVYLFTNGALREATKGHDFNRVLKALEDAKAFTKTGTNEKSLGARTPNNQITRFYWIDPGKLDH
jgi:putative DNA primase/helicase